MPAVIRGELTSVTVRFRHTEQKEASASLQVTLTDGEIIAAKCRQENGRITGYIGCNREDTLQKLQEKEEDFKQSVLSETGYSADITIVYSQDIKNSYYDTEQFAGKQMHTNTENRSEEVQGCLLYTSLSEMNLPATIRGEALTLSQFATLSNLLLSMAKEQQKIHS